MENEFFKIQMPKGYFKNRMDEWEAFNYYDNPLGVDQHGERVYDESPEPTKHSRIPHKILFELPQPMENFEYDGKGHVCRIFLYDDNSMPFNVRKEWFGNWMKVYFGKLSLLSIARYIPD